ncbi:ABC transporter ATP-binding protein [Methylicorpusculum oleiharenae]|uniref:ABC transporter ATP-binding protein n=1 Tax=Methylicorpusculum oleiharenae TaxID=1338687 RepID=UPI00135BC9E7|nr:ABC transporter ATP-binding protein [Methylicorpusculum oleiharenae]MCD2450813.1 ABC transporter ATP-binding protein [Methylicorpusculum oleiharenae]
MTDIAIKVENLSKCYQIYDKPQDRLLQMLVRGRKKYFKEFWALNDVSFEIKKGETFGIIGRNGSGKSTLLQILAGTLAQTSGDVIVNGRIAALLELGSGFNLEFTGRENVLLNGRILGLSQDEIEARYDQIVDFADIGDFIDQPVKTYSSGMFVRLAFAVQAHIDASIVIIDEALAVGDIFFRQKCYARLQRLRDSGAAILLVSHSMPDIEQFCERAILLDRSEMRFIGPSVEAAKHYYLLHQPQVEIENKPAIDKLMSESLVDMDMSIPDVFLDITNKNQVSNGNALCTKLALCDKDDNACNSFRQGDLAVFYFEFELAVDIGVPLCGVLITNERGIIVHGKNAWQYENDVPLGLGAGSRIFCRQEIALQLGPGEYTFEIGLAAVTQSDWERRLLISHEEWAASYSTVCVVPNAGQFSVGLAIKNGIQVLTHHGVADLPGTILTKALK